MESQSFFKFEIQHRDAASAARAGCFETAHGSVQTPVFMPVATHAVVRGHSTKTLADLEFPVLLANTYHLLLRPGIKVFQKFGGIHRFMNWPGAVLTDSGGYQIFSLTQYLTMSEEGAAFRSYIDGQAILLTPEVSIETQRAINSDIMMVLDQCLPAGAAAADVEKALDLTQRWALRSLDAKGDSKQALFAIVQGGCFKEMREKSAAQLINLPFDGFAIGGVAVGENKQLRDDIVQFTAARLPVHKPRYLMGVGTPLDLLEGVNAGIDMFDCILPTAWAQQGVCFTRRGKMDLRRGAYRMSEMPIEEGCLCETCRHYSRSYLHHLNKAGEFMAGTLIGVHNLTFYKNLMRSMREAILQNSFAAFYKNTKAELLLGDAEFPITLQAKSRRRPLRPEAIGNYTLHRHEQWVSIAQRSSGEVMHSVNDPLVESERLYIAQSGLRERLQSEPRTALTLWDVGLGAASNAMAAIHAYETLAKSGAPLAALHIVSFENDLDALRLALRHPGHFAHLRHPAPHDLLKSGRWMSKHGELIWTLYEGDFLQHLGTAPSPALIFFDPFSYKTDVQLWTLQTFSRILEHSQRGKTELFTYSASTSVRAALLAAGFFVARGVGSGPKEETTIALSGAPQTPWPRELLGRDWLERWERSHSQMPLDITRTEEAAKIAEQIRNHPQFRSINNQR